ncbi:hypothetical protein SYNPS1DRAFT_30290 [Syncephalis pseudoplumigaleata]|uniref:Secreted protein n=1 Tax=Syncephalis pseudoplumigaleata TaxID=1712513 RepID=A0A4P9YV92_9FUNG|nr:hypothetical protein SYNPS1DRAFT_30290 [Syncephalis pseudoplumigaleata]|eukprot:RKP23936.1 hypothetical protein SYNPS1DRAFT_30290 [Syncephalis pseudoplumigaleata]
MFHQLTIATVLLLCASSVQLVLAAPRYGEVSLGDKGAAGGSKHDTGYNNGFTAATIPAKREKTTFGERIVATPTRGQSVRKCNSTKQREQRAYTRQPWQWQARLNETTVPHARPETPVSACDHYCCYYSQATLLLRKRQKIATLLQSSSYVHASSCFTTISTSAHRHQCQRRGNCSYRPA